MPFFVSRQCYWGADPDEAHVVEVAGGGLYYANPDMLCPKFAGEGKEYDDPREAVTIALEIAKLWREKEPNKHISVAAGYTLGFTQPFEPSDESELVKRANATYSKMPKVAEKAEVRHVKHKEKS